SSLITVRLEVRVLPSPPRIPVRTGVSLSLTNSPNFAGLFAARLTGVPVSVARGSNFETAFGLRSLASANPFLARERGRRKTLYAELRRQLGEVFHDGCGQK